MKRLHLLISIMLICMTPRADIKAQSMNDLLGQINEMQKKTLTEVQEYHQRVLKQYCDLIGTPWLQTTGEDPVGSPLDKDTPVVPVPTIETERIEHADQILEAEVISIKTSSVPDAPRTVPEFRKFDSHDDHTITALINGYDISIRFPSNGIIQLSGTSEKEVAAAWEQMGNTPFDNMLKDIDFMRKYLKMSDWSFLMAVEKITESIYKKKDVPEAVLLKSFILNQMGYLISLGRSEKGTLHTLIATDMGILKYPHFRINGNIYYLFEKDYAKTINAVSLGLNGEIPMHMHMTTDELFYPSYAKQKKYRSSKYPALSVEISCDLNKMSHYEKYPTYFDGKNALSAFYYYAMTPLSNEIKDIVYPVFKEAIKGKSELEAVNMILHFVQSAFIYEYDKVLWGDERYLYADEIWRYNKSDCEDRSILFSNLVRDLVGLNVALVYWPGHLSCAVRFNEDVNGVGFMINGEKYISCDPTFVGSSSGAVMNSVKKLPASIIPL